MYCKNCGTELSEGAKFCPECGTKVGSDEMPEKISLVCKDCGGVMDVMSDAPVLACPYCGSKSLFKEDKEVTIARMKHELDKKKLDFEIESEKKAEENSGSFSLKFVVGMLLFMIIYALIWKFLM